MIVSYFVGSDAAVTLSGPFGNCMTQPPKLQPLYLMPRMTLRFSTPQTRGQTDSVALTVKILDVLACSLASLPINLSVSAPRWQPFL